jgi:CheY-like chemotaxis protein
MTVERIAVDPAQIIEEVVSLLRVRAAGKNLVLTSRYDTPIPRSIASDPVRLRQILMNLAGNAVKFTESGTVQIVASLAGTDEAPCLRIAIVDTGIGIEAEHVTRLFDAFTQADTSTTRRFGGTGLGLQISARLALVLGGTITATSTPGAGSAFTLTLPIGRASAADAHTPGDDEPSRAAGLLGPGSPADSAAASAEQSPSPLLGLRILLAEDGPDNQRLICHHLRRGGAEVTVVGNGKLALEALTQAGSPDAAPVLPAPFDVVLMDMQMPVMDGYAAAKAIKSAGCGVPVIALTAHAMSGEREKCLAAGCDDYTTKPILKEDLIRKCSQWARKEMSDG